MFLLVFDKILVGNENLKGISVPFKCTDDHKSGRASISYPCYFLSLWSSFKMKKIRIAALSVLVLSAGGFLAACGKNETKDTKEAGAREIRYSLPSDVLTLDTSMAADVNSIDVLLNVDAGLVRFDKDAKVVNDLAKSMDLSKDGKTYTVTLRDNLKWSNGEKLTAKDFVYGWQRTVDPKVGSQYAFALTPVANATDVMLGKKPVSSLGIKAISDSKLEINLANPTPYFTKILTIPAFYPVNQKFVEKQGKKYGTSSDTTLYNGAFKFVENKKSWTGTNKTFTVVKNDHFYDAKNVKTPAVSYQIVTNPTTGAELYKSNKVDVALLATPELVAANKSNAGYKALAAPRVSYLEYNQSGKVAALANLKIRQALNLATNRKELVKAAEPSALVAHTVTPAKLDNAPNGEDFAKYAAQDYKYDAKDAEKLFKEGLKELGVDSLQLDLKAPSEGPFNKAAADFMKANWEKDLPGLKVEIQLLPQAQARKDSESNNFQIMLSSWGADYNEPSNFLMNFVTGSSMNHGLVSNPAFDKLYQAATSTPDVLDAKTRYADYKDAEAELQKAANINPIATHSSSLLMNPKLKGVSLYNSAMIYDLRYAELTK